MSSQDSQSAPDGEGATIATLTGSSPPGGKAPVFTPITAAESVRPIQKADPDAELIAQGRLVEELSDREHAHFGRAPSSDGPERDEWSEQADIVTEEFRAGIEALAGIKATSCAGLAAKGLATLKMRAMFDMIGGQQEADLVRSLAEDAVCLGARNSIVPVVPAGDSQSRLLALGAKFEDAWKYYTAVYTTIEGGESNEAAVRESEAVDRVGHLVDEILKIPAITFEEVRVKARAFRWTRTGSDPNEAIDLGSTTDDQLMKSIIEDIEGMLPIVAGYHILPSPDLDKPIADAWAEYQRVRPLETAAYDREAELIKLFEKTSPKRPETMIPRNDDFPSDSIRYSTEHVDGISYYTPRVISIFRKTPRTRLVFDRWVEPGNFVDQVMKLVPDAIDQARADEIVAAYDGWIVDRNAFRDEIGLKMANEEADALGEERDRLSDIIRKTPALSLLGMQIKAAWARALIDEEDEDQQDLVTIIDQVEAFARRHAYLHRHKDIRAGEESIDLPAADWELYRLFGKWLESAIRLDGLYDHDEVHHDADYDASDLEREGEVNTELRRAIIDMPAISMHGARLKAHVYEWCNKRTHGLEGLLNEALEMNGPTDAAVAFSIARDLGRMACAASLTSMADRIKPAAGDPRALEAYRTWLSNEYRSLTAEMYPDHTSAMMGIGAVNNAGDSFHFQGEPPASTRAERMLAIFGLDWTQDQPSVFSDQQAAA